jgi:hypothetical protein
MTRVISASELDLLQFFEVTPTAQDPDGPWDYNDWLFEVSIQGIHLKFSIAPAYRDVRLKVQLGDRVLYELNSMGVEDVVFHEKPDREVLEIRLTERDRMFLRLRPQIELAHQLSEAQ